MIMLIYDCFGLMMA